jgi:hypothetical protein
MYMYDCGTVRRLSSSAKVENVERQPHSPSLHNEGHQLRLAQAIECYGHSQIVLMTSIRVKGEALQGSCAQGMCRDSSQLDGNHGEEP